MRIFNIIKKPVLSEKTYKIMENKNKFVFEVDYQATKSEIKAAFEALFEVKVAKIATQKKDGKEKRMGRYEGRKNHVKKAIITLKPGQNLEVFNTIDPSHSLENQPQEAQEVANDIKEFEKHLPENHDNQPEVEKTQKVTTQAPTKNLKQSNKTIGKRGK